MSGPNQITIHNDVTDKDLSPPDNLVADPKIELEEIKKAIKRHQKDNDDSCLEIGRLLVKAKKLFGKYGEWTDWLKDKKNVDMSVCKAQRLMKIAKWVDKLDGNAAPVPFSDFSRLYILSALTDKEYVQFLKGSDGDYAKPVAQLTKRELQAVVREFLKKKKQPSTTALAPEKPEVPAAPQNTIEAHVDKVKTALNELVGLIEAQGEDSDSHKLYTEELRELCNNIIGSLPDEELEGT